MPPRNTARKEDILLATDALFRVGLEHEVTLNDVAKAAKISKGTIYTYFKDKDDLFYQAEIYRMEHLVANLEDNVQESDPFATRIAALFEVLEDFFAERVPIIGPQHLLRLKTSTTITKRLKEFRAVRRILLNYLEALIEQGIDDGDIRPEISAKVVARHIMASIIFRRLTRVVDEAPVEMRDIVPLFLHGIATHKV